MGVMDGLPSKTNGASMFAQPRGNPFLSAVIGLGLSLVFIWLAFRGLDMNLILRHMGNLRPAPVLVCLATQVLCQVWRLVRWGLMLRSLGEISWERVVAIGSVGTPAVTLLPARIGELVRPVFVAEETDIDFGKASATVVAERIVDGGLMSLVFFFGIILLRDKGSSDNLLISGLVFAAIFVIGAIGIWLAFRFQTIILRLLDGLSGVSLSASRLSSRVFGGFVTALAPILSRRVLAPYLAISVALWATEAISIYSLFGVTGQVFPFSASIIILVAIVVGTLIPSGPAHLGVFEFSVIVGLSFFNPPAGTGAFFGAILHLLQVVVLLGFAFFGVWLGKIRFERLLKLGRPERQSV